MADALCSLRAAMYPERELPSDYIEKINAFATSNLQVHFVRDGDASNAAWVGYKIGYEEKPDSFFSWVGGVHPAFRNQGIATQLLRNQHEWALSQGYTYITTRSNNAYKPMMRLNLKEGFDIIGTRHDGPRVQILFSKQLLKHPHPPIDNLPTASET